ncbi:SHOCT domain-containing protein [Paenibacillus ihumii]|uniref:SHOCT domain-containing protein n=1 Tax=Paenibacillus ihumii TaxID=687436 RepID=UPI0006D7B7DF|nr:SHOCT domain-containing protein [Paenibacillus ihumii]
MKSSKKILILFFTFCALGLLSASLNGILAILFFIAAIACFPIGGYFSKKEEEEESERIRIENQPHKIANELQKLKELFENDFITLEEYESKKQQLQSKFSESKSNYLQ